MYLQDTHQVLHSTVSVDVVEPREVLLGFGDGVNGLSIRKGVPLLDFFEDRRIISGRVIMRYTQRACGGSSRFGSPKAARTRQNGGSWNF